MTTNAEIRDDSPAGDAPVSDGLALYAPIPYRVDTDEPVTCPHCQLKNDTDASFCDQCGTELTGRSDVSVGGTTVDPYAPEPYDPEADETVQCPDCEKVNDPDCRFCDQCGASLVGRTDVKTNGPVEDVDNVSRPADQDDDQPSTDEQAEAAENQESQAAEPDAGEENVGADANRSKAPRENVIRKVAFRAEQTDGLTLEGYAAVFDDPAMIDSWEGTFRESIARGSFSKTISERSPVLMFDHGQHPMVGSIPIGTITALREDPHGLYVKAKLNDNWLVEPVRDAIRSGGIDGMSIRMSVIQDDWSVGDDHIAQRSIKEVALAELGPVVFPAYENTQVSVRSRDVLTALSDPEVRGEIARVFASGTDIPSAASQEDEPASSHSTRTRSQRQALRLRAYS